MFAAARRCGCGVVVATILAFVVAIVVAFVMVVAVVIVMVAVDASVAVAGLVSVVSLVPLAAVGVAVPTAVDVVFRGVDYARSSNIILFNGPSKLS